MKISDQRIGDFEFASLEKRHTYISNADKFPVEPTATGYQYTLEFTEIMENIYISIVNDNSQIVLSYFAIFLIVGTACIIVTIGIGIWKKFKK